MEIELLYFAAVRELVGVDRESWTLGADVRDVGALAAALEAAHPRLEGRLASCRFAVNEEFAPTGRRLADGDVVAVIPPVAGGSDARPARERVGLSVEPLSVEDVLALVRHPAAGALASFVGVVRDHHRGRAVTELEYSAYASMAEAELARIVEEIEAEEPGVRLAARHRLGRLSVGEDAVVCAASAPHRDAAFTAGRALIDRIKERVPIWKRERGPDGEWWVGWDDERGPSAAP